MREARRWWRLPWAALLIACVGPGGAVRPRAVVLGDGRPLLAGWGAASLVETEESGGPSLGVVTARQQESECRLAAAYLWRLLAPVDSVGAEVEATFWTDQGALTMLSWRRGAEGTIRGAVVDDRSFVEKFAGTLLAIVGDGRRALHLTMRREERGWELQTIRTSDEERPPPQAKTLGVDTSDIAAGPFAVLEREARTRWLPWLRVPADGTARLDLQVELDDYRLASSSVIRYEKTGSGAAIAPPPGFDTEVAGALVPFTEGLGRHSVWVTLRATRASGQAGPRWRVETATMVRPTTTERAEPFTSRTDYRLLHEEIVRRWREDVHAAAAMAAAFTAEQVALWVASAWAARGVGFALEMASGPVMRVLGRGGPEATGWLFTLLRRAPQADRAALARLWAKVETQGVEALAAEESLELRAAFLRLERLAATPLTDLEKRDLRSLARKKLWRYLEAADPAASARLARRGRPYDVHHRFPCEYAHLDVERDLNAISNLAAVDRAVHDSMGRMWTAFRASRSNIGLAEVRRMVEIIDRHYGRWFNAPYDVAHQAQLVAAEHAARMDLQALLTAGGSF